MSAEPASEEPMKVGFRTYRAALALNNMAITLMQKGSYGPAHKTLTESLGMMKKAFHVSNNETNNESDTSINARIHMVSQAAERRCSTCVSKRRDRGIMEIRPIVDGDFAVLRNAVRYGPTSFIAFPILISEAPPPCNGPSGPTETDDVGRQLGVVFYNHGLACLLVSLDGLSSCALKENPRNKTSEESIKNLFDASNKSLQLSDRTFTRLLGSPETAHGKSAVVELMLLLLSALVLNCLSIVLQKQNLLKEAKEAHHLVHMLCSDVDQDCLSSVLLYQESAPAA